MQDSINNTPCLFKHKEECCGCTACYAVCPCRAIEMYEDDEGFLYPRIIENKCIGCNKCISVCPFKKDSELRCRGN